MSPLSKISTLDALESLAVIAVIRAPSAKQALLAIDTLVDAGITGIEVTFTTPEAPLVISQALSHYADRAVVGAGTITNPEQLHQAVAAGAQFLVSPGTEPRLTREMVDTGVVTMTGALTPSEIMLASNLGVDVMKIFPGSLGGPDYLKALRGPFPELRFMPTGGVTASNLAQWFDSGALAVGVGGELVPASAWDTNDVAGIAARAGQFVEALASCGKGGRNR